MSNKCFFHPQAESAGICFSCGREFCNDCLSDYRGKQFCNSDGCKLAKKILLKDVDIAAEESGEIIESVVEQSPVILRMVNYIIDFTTVSFIMNIFLTLFVKDVDEIFKNKIIIDDLGIILFEIIALFFYFFIFETFFQKTPGKFVTNTKVVTLDNQKPGAKVIVFRTLFRFLPFEILSYRKGRWWHDRLSKTIVVKTDRSYF